MKVVVFGAGGKTGKLVVERALAAGHEVTIFVHGDEYTVHEGVQVVTGDANDPADVRNGVIGQEAVIDTIGGKTPYKDTELERTVAAHIVAAMKAEGVRRLVVVSMMGIGESREQTPFWYEHLLMPTFLRGADKDKTAMEAEVKGSGLEFVIARPPILTDDEGTGTVVVVSGEGKGHTITRVDLAEFLVEQLVSDQYLGQAVVVANS